MTEKVLVIGAGIAGLCCALSLAPTGREIVLIERDSAPPADDPNAVFRDWKRTGVGQLRQSHAFLARLRNIIKADHPVLLQRLAKAGVRDLPFQSMLTTEQLATYIPRAEDDELTIITSRRTTLELTMRNYVLTLPNVTIQHGILVKKLLTEKTAGDLIKVVGLVGEANGAPIEMRADIVADASGKSGFTLEQLKDEGASISEESESSGILYFTRHYRLRPGQEEPSRTENPPASGDLGFLKFGIFPGDGGNFSVTIAIPDIELELRKSIPDADVFHKITLMLPGLFPWTNEARAEGTSKVFSMGNLQSRWRELVVEEKPAALNYFALGDTLVRTNPLYGRGCSFAAVSADILRQTLEETGDPKTRALGFHTRIRAELRPFFENMLKQDRGAIKLARAALTPNHKPSFRARLLKSFLEDGVRIAARSDTDLMRDAMRGFHMLEHPDKWLGKPKNLFKVLYYWSRGKRKNAAAYPPEPGPSRAEMMAALALDAQADIQRTVAAEKLAA